MLDLFRKLFRLTPPKESALDATKLPPVDETAVATDPPTKAKQADLDTAPLSELPEDQFPLSDSLAQPPGFYVGRRTDVGQYRENNQDSFFTATTYLETSRGADPFGLFIVADGAGGHQGGELASALAARTMAATIFTDLYLPLLIEDRAAQKPLAETLQEAVQQANLKVTQEVPGAASTLTVAAMLGREIYFAHVGDSRAYIYENGRLRQVTKDHSMTARLIEIGQLSPAEAENHPMRSTLYRAIGQTSRLDVDIMFDSLPEQSYLLICSDGLWGMVSDEEITHILNAATNPVEAAHNLVDQANQNGGEDNITALVIAYEDPPPAPPLADDRLSSESLFQP